MPAINLPALFAAAAALVALALQTPPARAADDLSTAERALFVDNQLGGLQPPLTLRYSYRSSGSLVPGFDDTVAIAMRRGDDGACCAASAEFLHGERQLLLPDIEAGQGNPVILYFLERDIREMQRLTKGQSNYFRKRIRMAVYRGASVRRVQLAWDGRPVDGQEIAISPYLDDPLRVRFEQLARKQYLFTLSSAVPGGVYSIRTLVAGPAPGSPPLLSEEIQLMGIDPAGTQDKPPATATRRQP